MSATGEASTAAAELDYEEIVEEFTEEFRDNFGENVGPTGMGVESENPIVREEDGIMPLAPQYQDIISEGLWESIEEELEENVEGYGEDFSFELKGIAEKGHFEERPTEMKVEQDQEGDEVIDAPGMDWEIGPQLEIDSGAFEIDSTGNFGTLLDILESMKQGTRKYMAENYPELVFANQGVTRQFRNPEDVPDEVEKLEDDEKREVIKRGIESEYSREDAVQFAEDFYHHTSSTPYGTDYNATIFGPKILENMFGGSTQLTSGLWTESGEIDVDERMSEEMAYRIVFEGAFDVLTSNVYPEEDGENQQPETGVNRDYWENSAYGQHFLDDADVDEDAVERTGTPWNVIDSMMDNEEDAFQGMVDEYMTGHHMAWIAKPEREHVEFEDEMPDDFDYDGVVMFAVDPDEPKTPREYIEDGEVGFSKMVKRGEDSLERVKGTIDLTGMNEDELKEYHKGNFAEQQIGGLHHDIRPKFATGGFEYRNSRQNYEDEPSVALAKAAIMPHGDKIREAMEEHGINPADPETVPDYDNEEIWGEVFSQVYDDEVMATAEAMAPGYAEEFAEYVEERLEGRNH